MSSRDPAALPDVLDHGCELALRCASPWLGVLWLGVFPLRLAFAHLVATLWQLGPSAPDHVPLVARAGTLLALALVPAIVARSLFVRALVLGDASGVSPGRETWRIPPADVAAHAVLAAALALVAAACAPIFVAWPLVLALGGVAAAVTCGSRGAPRGLAAPVVLLARGLVRPAPVLGLALIFVPAVLLAGVNLHAGAQLALWLTESVSVAGVARWRALLDLGSPAYGALLLGAALSVAEPFWLGCHVALQQRLRQRHTGEDLLRAFRRAWQRSEEPRRDSAA